MIETITPENIKDCIPVYLKSYNQPPWNYHWTYEKAEQYLSEYLASRQFAGFVLYDQGQAVGALFGHTKTWWTNQQLMIDEFFVSAEKQKMGYGKKLLQHCTQYSLEREIASIVLMTNKYMPAHNFYSNAGFTNAEQFVFMFQQIL
jgi:aminoglycoside 6'-N-acetyltransferase I